VKWKIELQMAFCGQHSSLPFPHSPPYLLEPYLLQLMTGVDRMTRGGKWFLFILSMITILRKGNPFPPSLLPSHHIHSFYMHV